MPRERRAGYDTFWQDWQRGARRALALHCAQGHSGMWAPVAGALPLHVTAFDLPGHGHSAPWPADRDFQGACAEIAATFCDGPTDLIGHSFGATVALRLALERPELCRSLSLVEPVFFAAARAAGAPEATQHDRDFAPFLAAAGAGDHMTAARVFSDLWSEGPSFDSLDPSRQARLAAQVPLVMAGAPGIEEDSGEMLAPGRLEALSVPVLLIRGARTQPMVGAVHRALIARLPDAREEVIEGAGHMVPVVRPGPVAEAIRRHLSP
ncbi:alpha/beta fold hydrolase [Oceaniglobus roseus]|uniref:alpha/beta fold hydrolase n=1 Tax=Oceaniglobus roseus TaxID=1737570 RepID=UPI000C7EFA55|nr:alpha/beta hydrolase [Kandeliimicrobium roseum]